jgi:hypothetical protein
MSLHYEWVLSLRLRTDVPDAFVDELRFHLGLADERPVTAELDYEYPIFAIADDDALPGGSVSSLKFQTPDSKSGRLGLYVRTFALDDDMYDLMLTVPPWLARWAATEGWIGFAREELALDPWLNFYAANGYAYVAAPGDRPNPAQDGAPPFTATQTLCQSPPA